MTWARGHPAFLHMGSEGQAAGCTCGPKNSVGPQAVLATWRILKIAGLFAYSQGWGRGAVTARARLTDPFAPA
jgi:hypothetical protein